MSRENVEIVRRAMSEFTGSQRLTGEVAPTGKESGVPVEVDEPGANSPRCCPSWLPPFEPLWPRCATAPLSIPVGT
jgi:hypothetical protein